MSDKMPGRPYKEVVRILRQLDQASRRSIESWAQVITI